MVEKNPYKYFTGQPCKHGHISERYTSSYNCVECAQIRNVEKLPYSPLKAKKKRQQERHSEKHRYKSLARRKLEAAIRLGEIKRLACEVCGETKSHGHHENYFKPLEVNWLCAIHHKLRHQEIRNHRKEG